MAGNTKQSKKIELGIKDDPKSFKVLGSSNMVKSKGNYYQSAPAEAKAPEEMLDPGYLVSRQNHPVTLSYEGEALVIPPRGRVRIANKAKLGGLTMGVAFIPAPELKK